MLIKYLWWKVLISPIHTMHQKSKNMGENEHNFFIVSRTPATWRKWIKYTVINRFAQILSINSSTQWRTFECCKLNCGVDEYNF